MHYLDWKPWPLARLTAAGACALALLCASGPVRAADVTVPGTTDFPESLSATSDGTLYFSSLAGGRIFRAAPGAAQASEFIKQGELDSAIGVLADDKTNTLYVCSSDLSGAGIKIPTGATPTALKTFDLKTGAAKGSYTLPASTLPDQKPFCNDIAIGADGTAYATDSLSGHILRLKPGAKELEIWAHDPRWDVKSFQLDGIAILPDGSVYANIYDGDGLYRVAAKSDGSAGEITKLETSRALFHSDGLKPMGANKLLMVEGETKGNLDLITVEGNKATITTIKGGFKGPVGLSQVGDTVYVLDVPLSYLFDPKLKSEKPPPFTAYAVKLPQ